MFKKLCLMVFAVGLMTMTTGGVALANPPIHKSYVCKYVGTPGPGERLQTGQNPIFVDNSSLTGKDEDVAVGDTFSDAQGRSVVIVANTDKLDPEPSVTDCPLTPPEPEVTVDSEQRMSCEAGVEARKITTTTPYVYDYETNEWVLGEPVVTYGDWMFVRDLTAAERDELNCDVPPALVRVDTVPDRRMTCAGVETRDTITKIVTPYILVDGEFVLDNKNAVVTERVTNWTFVRDLTAQEKIELGCVNPPPPNPPVNPNPPAVLIPPAVTPPQLPATGSTGLGVLGLIGMSLIGSGGFLYRKFGMAL